jgi:cytochrome c oxidase subunit 2
MTAQRSFLATCLVASGACSGVQSSLAPAGREAQRIADLTWWMTVGAIAIWLAVAGLAVHYARPHDEAPSRTRDRWLIIGAGVVVPIVVLTALLAYGLAMLPPLIARAPEGSLTVHVHGEMWWWRVRYLRPGGEAIELANEIRLPVHEPVQFRLTSDNVIHSFWIPALAGKMDMIPGRTTFLALQPEATGTFAGACAEYCGTAHAFMRFLVQVMERPAFDEWLTHQATVASPPETPLQERGRDVMLANGCGACHAVRGTSASGVIGPDLTHIGSRMSLAAGTLPTDRAAFERWLSSPQRIKPAVHMPAFGMIGDADVAALAAYLRGLQ